VELARPARLHARPRDGEAVGAQPQVLDVLDVLLPPVEVVVRDVARVAVQRLAGRVRERVPDGRAAPALRRTALDLVGRGRGSPEEVAGETPCTHSATSPGPVARTVLPSLSTPHSPGASSLVTRTTPAAYRTRNVAGAPVPPGTVISSSNPSGRRVQRNVTPSAHA